MSVSVVAPPRNQVSKKPQQSEWFAGVAILADFPSNDINDLAHGFKSPCNHTHCLQERRGVAHPA